MENIESLNFKINCILIAIVGLSIIYYLIFCNENNKKCIESHTEVRFTHIYNGISMRSTPITVSVCDKYEEN